MNATTRTFPTPPDLWPTVEQWAAANGYLCKESTGSTRLYQRGVGFLVAPMMLHLSEAGGTVTMDAWVSAGLFVRACALFIIPSSMGIESGGFKMVLPRKMARGKVNDLLGKLGQPPIP